MSQIERTVARMRDASPRAQIALAAECGARVLPVYEEYWVGSYYEEVGRGVEIGWTYASGATVDAEEARSCRDALQDLVTFYHEEDIDVLAAAVTVVLRVLQAVSADDEEERSLAVERALFSAGTTAQYAEGMADQGAPRAEQGDVALAEEREWQSRAASLIAEWEGPPSRGMFDSLGPKPPRWLLDWLARSVR